ncbi:MAG: 6-phosphogluconolactonase [Thiotrichales bacterium]|nr:MAG: 6-phosphogluconolactonase [Thiotrichales bacterium]
MPELSVFADAESVAQAAADYLASQISACVNARGVCHVALPGGSTPARCLELLSQQDLPWQKIHWYLGDERCYPVGHEERNDRMIERQLWSRIDAPAQTRHPIAAELGPQQAAKHYAGLIDAVGRLDIVVLGMGEDGHTASLFPENSALDSDDSVVAVYHAPKPPAERVTLGLKTIQSAEQRIVLVSGSGKREALNQIERGVKLPISRIGPSSWFVDEAAAPDANGI